MIRYLRMQKIVEELDMRKIQTWFLVFIAFSSGVGLAQNYEPPRTASGKPDLQGYWTNASITTMQRATDLSDLGLTIPDDQVARLLQAIIKTFGRQRTTIRFRVNCLMAQIWVVVAAITHFG